MAMYMEPKQRLVLITFGVLLILAGGMMLMRIYPFETPLAMPGGSAGVITWFWWIVGGWLLPITLVISGIWMIINGFRG